MPLKKAIGGLYIHTASKNSTVYFENVGKVSVREVFKNTDKDLQVMIKARNKVFKELRGVWLYEKLLEYVNKMDDVLKDLELNFRFTKILNRTAVTLREALNDVKHNYDDARELNDGFQQIRQIFGENKTSKEEKEEKLGIKYDSILAKAKQRTPELKTEDLKVFLPNKRNPRRSLWVNGIDYGCLIKMAYLNITIFQNSLRQTWCSSTALARKSKQFLAG